MAQTAFQRDYADWLNQLHGIPMPSVQPFMPGGRLDILHGGILDPRVQGSLGNSGYAIIGKLFGSSNPGGEGQKAYDYFNAPLTGPAPPAKPPVAAKPAMPGNSFRDPGWNQMDQIGAARAGMPQLADMLFAIRTSGERSNNDQVSSTGAKSVYQITPQTRDLFKKKYGVDAYNSPQDAATVAALHLKESIQRGGDPIREYIGGPDKSKWGPQTMAYGQRVGGALGAFQQAADAVGLNQPPPAFNSAGYDQAQQLLGKAQQLQMQPFGAKYTETPLPELPKPDALQAPDYSKGDAAFEAARPKNPFEQDGRTEEQGKLKIRRADYFAGMAQALNSIDWSRGVGLGELFAKLGAGALMGAKAGDSEVQDRMDKFDAAMQNYNLALANRDDTKAREQINIANQNIQGMNQYKRDLWAVQTKEIERHNPRIENGVLVTFNKNEDGSITENHTPLDPARQTAAVMAQANVAMARGNAANESTYQMYRANREFAGAALPYAMADAAAQGNLQGRDGLFAIGLAEAANSVAETGRWSDLYKRYLPGGAEQAKHRLAEAYTAADVPIDENGNLMPGTKIDSQTQQRINDYLSTKIMEDFTNNGKSWVLTGGETENRDTKERKINQPSSAVVSSVASQREQDRKVSRTVNAKGQVSTTERY